jgi:hypothetical protein
MENYIESANFCNENPLERGCPSTVNSTRHGTSQCLECGLVFYTVSGIKFVKNRKEVEINHLETVLSRPKS